MRTTIERCAAQEGPAVGTAETADGGPVVVPLDDVIDVADLQRAVRSLCQALGLERRDTFEWMLGFADLALAMLPVDTHGARVLLRPLRRRGRVGLEMTFENAARAACGHLKIGRWLDECEMSPEPGPTARLLARKWRTVPGGALH